MLEVLKRGSTATVLLAEGEAGERVVVKVLRAAEDPDGSAGRRFVAQVESLRRVSAFCTAQVLETGLDGERPYIVTEYVEGPTLASRVAAEGPLREGELYRFAIGSMTGLVAIHQADVVHLAFNPDNVLLGADGPRVINFGLARAVGATLTTLGRTTRMVAGMPYLAPEQFEEGEHAGPAADVFSWAATMVFAATGRPPLGEGGGEAAARIAQGPPDLSAFDERLRGIVAACLSADPARRPPADQVLFRLLEDTSAAPGAPAAGRRRLGVVLGVAAGITALVVAGTVLYLNRPQPADRQAAATASRPASPAASQAPTPRPATGPVQASRRVRLPGLNATLNEDPADPVRLTGYLAEKDLGTYLRSAKTGEFTRTDELQQPVTSPDGIWTAFISWAKFSETSTDSVRFVQNRTGIEFSVKVGEKPLGVVAPVWSRDSRKLLLTLYEFGDPGGAGPTRQGFVIVDPESRRPTTVDMGKGRDVGAYTWTPDGRQVARITGDDEDVYAFWYDLRGKQVRKSGEVGPVFSRTDWFSPSGLRYFTVCPGTPKSVCVWNTATGDREAVVPSGTPEDVAKPVGWFDDRHLILTEFRKNKNRFVVVDLDGEVRRVLTEIPAEQPMFNVLLDFTAVR